MSSCTHKGKAYTSEEDARKGAQGANRHRSIYYPLVPFMCSECWHWHLKVEPQGDIAANPEPDAHAKEEP